MEDADKRKKLEKLWECYKECCFNDGGMTYNSLYRGEAIAYLLLKSSSECWSVSTLLDDVKEALDDHRPLDVLDDILKGLDSEVKQLQLDVDDTNKIENVIDIINNSDEIQHFIKDFANDDRPTIARFVRYIGFFFQC
jgi:hypothetical protein